MCRYLLKGYGSHQRTRHCINTSINIQMSTLSFSSCFLIFRLLQCDTHAMQTQLSVSVICHWIKWFIFKLAVCGLNNKMFGLKFLLFSLFSKSSIARTHFAFSNNNKKKPNQHLSGIGLKSKIGHVTNWKNKFYLRIAIEGFNWIVDMFFCVKFNSTYLFMCT